MASSAKLKKRTETNARGPLIWLGGEALAPDFEPLPPVFSRGGCVGRRFPSGKVSRRLKAIKDEVVPLWRLRGAREI